MAEYLVFLWDASQWEWEWSLTLLPTYVALFLIVGSLVQP